MNVIVLSLERAPERRERIKKQLEDLHLDAVIMDAVDGMKLSEAQKNKFINNPFSRFRDGEKFKPGEIGCIMSTINAIKLARDKKWENVVILDDDVILSKEFERGVKIALKLAPSNWDHILLGGHIYMNAAPVFQPAIIPVSYKISGSYAYILRENVYHYAIASLSSFDLPVDDIYERMARIEGNLKSYIFFPFIAYPNVEDSYIWNVFGDKKVHPSIQYFKDKIL